MNTRRGYRHRAAAPPSSPDDKAADRVLRHRLTESVSNLVHHAQSPAPSGQGAAAAQNRGSRPVTAEADPRTKVGRSLPSGHRISPRICRPANYSDRLLVHTGERESLAERRDPRSVTG